MRSLPLVPFRREQLIFNTRTRIAQPEIDSPAPWSGEFGQSELQVSRALAIVSGRRRFEPARQTVGSDRIVRHGWTERLRVEYDLPRIGRVLPGQFWILGRIEAEAQWSPHHRHVRRHACPRPPAPAGLARRTTFRQEVPHVRLPPASSGHLIPRGGELSGKNFLPADLSKSWPRPVRAVRIEGSCRPPRAAIGTSMTRSPHGFWPTFSSIVILQRAYFLCFPSHGEPGTIGPGSRSVPAVALSEPAAARSSLRGQCGASKPSNPA